MKKLCTFIALTLTIAMLPASALAAPSDAMVIQLSDPTITLDGEHVATMEGLIMQLALCASDDGSLVQLIFDLFAGGENTTSAMLQIDDSAVVAYLSGMSNAYSISTDELSSELEAYMGLDQLEGMTSALESWTLPADIQAVMDAHAGDFTVSEPYAGVSGAGDELEFTDISGDMTGVMTDMLALMENDALVGGLLALYGEEDALDGFAEELAAGRLAFGLEGSLGVNETGDIAEYTADISYAQNGQPAGECAIRMYRDASVPSNVLITESLRFTDAAGAELMDIDLYMTTDDGGFSFSCEASSAEETASIQAAGSFTNSIDAITMAINATSPEYETPVELYLTFTNMKTASGMNALCRITGTEESGEYTSIDLSLTTNETDNDISIAARLSATADGETAWLNLDIYDDYATGECGAMLTAGDGVTAPVSIAARLTPTAAPEGVDSSAIVDVILNDGYSEMVMSSTLNVLTAQADTDSFYIDPAAAIDLMTISDAEIENAISELEAALNSIDKALEKAYPDIY